MQHPFCKRNGSALAPYDSLSPLLLQCCSTVISEDLHAGSPNSCHGRLVRAGEVFKLLHKSCQMV